MARRQTGKTVRTTGTQRRGKVADGRRIGGLVDVGDFRMEGERGGSFTLVDFGGGNEGYVENSQLEDDE